MELILRAVPPERAPSDFPPLHQQGATAPPPAGPPPASTTPFPQPPPPTFAPPSIQLVEGLVLQLSLVLVMNSPNFEKIFI